jgi:hypothetical protein
MNFNKWKSYLLLLIGLESVGGNRVFSATLWQHLIPAGSLITANE